MTINLSEELAIAVLGNAVKLNQTDTIKGLLEAGVKISERGSTMFLARRYGTHETIRLLREAITGVKVARP